MEVRKNMSDLGHYHAEDGEPVYDPELDSQLDRLAEEVESGLPGESLGVNPLDDQYSADTL